MKKYRLDRFDIFLENSDAALQFADLFFAIVDFLVVIIDLHQIFLLLVCILFFGLRKLVQLILSLLDLFVKLQ